MKSLTQLFLTQKYQTPSKIFAHSLPNFNCILEVEFGQSFDSKRFETPKEQYVLALADFEEYIRVIKTLSPDTDVEKIKALILSLSNEENSPFYGTPRGNALLLAVLRRLGETAPEINAQLQQLFGHDQSTSILHKAAESGNISVLKLLLDPLDPNLAQETCLEKDQKNRNALHHAAQSGDLETLQYILEKLGSRKNDAANEKDWGGLTPLFYAVYYGTIETAELLLMGLCSNASYLQNLVDGYGSNLLFHAQSESMKDFISQKMNKKATPIADSSSQAGRPFIKNRTQLRDALEKANNDEFVRLFQDAIDSSTIDNTLDLFIEHNFGLVKSTLEKDRYKLFFRALDRSGHISAHNLIGVIILNTPIESLSAREWVSLLSELFSKVDMQLIKNIHLQNHIEKVLALPEIERYYLGGAALSAGSTKLFDFILPDLSHADPRNEQSHSSILNSIIHTIYKKSSLHALAHLFDRLPLRAQACIANDIKTWIEYYSNEVTRGNPLTIVGNPPMLFFIKNIKEMTPSFCKAHAHFVQMCLLENPLKNFLYENNILQSVYLKNFANALGETEPVAEASQQLAGMNLSPR